MAEWFPEIADRSLRQVAWPEIEAHRERIKGMARGGHRGPPSTSACVTTGGDASGLSAEVLSAEVDQRAARRQARRVIEARFPRA